MLSRQQPDQGNRLYLAELKIVEFLKPVALNKAALRAELEWMQNTITEMRTEAKIPETRKFFEGVADFVERQIGKLDDDD
jgi:hypothetical protein